MSDQAGAAYVISFNADATERLSLTLAEWGWHAEWIPAIRGSEVPETDVDLRSIAHLSGRDVSLGMIGCAASHRVAYEALLAGNQPWALVLEDDAELLGDAASLPTFDDLCGDLAQEPTIVQLATRGSRFLQRNGRVDPIGRYYRFRFGYPPGQTLSYLINRRAAGLLLTRPIDGPADWPSAAAHINFLGVYPWLFRESGRPSTIEGQTAMRLRWRIAQACGLNSLLARRYGVSPAEAWKVSTAPYLASFWDRRVASEAPFGPDGPKVPFAWPHLRRSSRH